LILNLLVSETIEESSLLYIGNLNIQFFPSIENPFNPFILENCIHKLNIIEMPAIIKSFILMFSRFILIDLNKILDILYKIKINEKSGLQILLEKWLSSIDFITEKKLKNLSLVALSNLIKSENKILEKIFLNEYNYDENNRNAEDNSIIRIFSILLNNLYNEINQQESDNEIEERYYNNNENIETFDEINLEDLSIKDKINLDIDLKVSLNFLYYF